MLHERLGLMRPLAFFDCETTGKYPDRDRIVELTITLLLVDGEQSSLSTLVNPTIPIPAEVTAIHGITDDMVKGQPTFRDLASVVAATLADCDLAGYNIRRFDVPLLVAEFRRTPVAFSVEGRKQIDMCSIFHKREPRDLAAALKFFCGSHEHDGAHRTKADVDASIAVLAGQLEKYSDLPSTVDALHDYCKDASWIDDAGKLVWISGVACVGFGTHAGRPLESMAAEPQGRDYLRWILGKDFPADTKAIVSNALNGKLPALPAAAGAGAEA